MDHAVRWLKNRRLVEYDRAWLRPDPEATTYVQGRAWRLSELGEIAAQANGYVTGLTRQTDLREDQERIGWRAMRGITPTTAS